MRKQAWLFFVSSFAAKGWAAVFLWLDLRVLVFGVCLVDASVYGLAAFGLVGVCCFWGMIAGLRFCCC